MWVPWVVEGLKVILVWFVLEAVYGGGDDHMHLCEDSKEC